MMDIFLESNQEKRGSLIDQLYKINEDQKNSLTGKSGNAISAMLCAWDPFNNLNIVSLKHRKKLIDYFKFEGGTNFENDSTGEQIAKSNDQIINGYKSLGLKGSINTITRFFYRSKKIIPWITELEEDKAQINEKDDIKSSSSNPNFWIEKTICHNRPDRLAGDFSLGNALWSPQESQGGQDLYKNMRVVQPGDVVIHFADNKGIKGLSIVKLECDDSFMGVDNTEWSGRPAYLVKLNNYVDLDPFFDRETFLGNSKYREELKTIRKNHNGLFYQDDLNLRQGAYLTAAPLDLVLLLNRAYKDFSNKLLPYIQYEEEVDIAMEESTDPRESPLNLIYYGPPGTGKTYNAIRQAVKICDGKPLDDENEFSQRLKELLGSDQISMVTFHQSYGYEEFVEGIRPVLFEGGDGGSGEPLGDGIQYECRDGIFKKLCLLAKESPSSSVQPENLDLTDANVWKMSLGNTLIPDQAFIYDDCIKNNYILLGYGEGLDFSECNNREEVRDKLRGNNPDIKDNDYHITSVNIFKNKVKIDDLVIISDGNRKFRAIGQIVGDYQFFSESEYGQMRPVKWLAIFDESLPREKIIKKVFSQATIYQLHNKILKIDGLSDLLSPKSNKLAKNYVLIVDEINRGNVSKILGELITLLEPDKRLDAPNEIIVT
ncbi:MAG: hypothetical protein HOK41_03805, partial [Nitrospina sp.]|nr:hypothetical protein [Nitrospina sp.]